MKRLVHWESYYDYGQEAFLSIGSFYRVILLSFHASQYESDVLREYLETRVAIGFLDSSLININIQLLCWTISVDLFKIIPSYEKYIYND